MSTAMVKADTGIGIERKTIEFDKFIELAWKSGAYKDIQNAQQAAMKVVFGHALGLDPATSLVSIHLIQGKPTMSANLMAGRAKQYGGGKYRYTVVKKDDKECSIQFHELIEDWTSDGKQIKRWVDCGPPETFTMKMAETAGLTKNDTWKKYPSNMLFSRCISNGIKTYCPEVLSGLPVYTPDELDPSMRMKVTADGDMVPDYDVVQTTATVLDPVKVQPADQSVKNLIQLAADTKTNLKEFLINQFGVAETQQLTLPQIEQATQVLKLKASGQKLGAAAAK